jgi:FkbM family methyltransferase
VSGQLLMTDSQGPLGGLRTMARRWIGVHPQSYVTPLANLDWLGSRTHGYYVPAGLLDASSVCYCVGAGDDITFDTELARLYGCQVMVVDPTPEGREHFEHVRGCLARGEPVSVDSGGVFPYRISAEGFERLKYLDIGVMDKPGTLRFYKPTREGYTAHSAVLFKESGRYIELPVDRLAHIMKREGHRTIDLLKLEIEGAEYTVLETVAQDRLDVRAIVVEYDEFFHQKDKSYLFRIRASARTLMRAGYRLVHSTDTFKRLFVRGDVCDQLAAPRPHT